MAQTTPPAPPYMAGDVLVVVRVAYRGFSGATDAWVVAPAWDSFLRELTALEQQRQGAAQVESISPGEFQLRIFSTDHAGHMAVEGFVGMRGEEQELLLEYRSVRFDPSQLPELVAELARGAVNDQGHR